MTVNFYVYRALARYGGLPKLRHLDLSGCLQVTAEGLLDLVFVCPTLDHTEFFYCDNIDEGPYPDTASGCQNLQCKNRVCCRTGEWGLYLTHIKHYWYIYNVNTFVSRWVFELLYCQWCNLFSWVHFSCVLPFYFLCCFKIYVHDCVLLSASQVQVLAAVVSCQVLTASCFS